MTEHDFDRQWEGLVKQIDDLPSPAKEHLLALAEETKGRHGRMKKTLGELQESLDYLRLSVKYLVFDLEATRRENGYLRKLLENRGHPGYGTGGEQG